MADELLSAPRIDYLSGLPDHILVRIASHVDTTKTTRNLAALGLVCRSLASAVKGVLWKDVKWPTLYPFVRLFEQGNKQVFGYVQTLNVKVHPGSLEHSQNWLIFSQMPHLHTLLIHILDHIKYPSQSRPSILLPPQTITFPVLERLYIAGKHLNHYDEICLGELTRIEEIDLVKSFPKVKELVLEVPDSAVVNMCDALSLGKKKGFPVVDRLEVRTNSGVYEKWVRLDVLAPGAKSILLFYENWSPADLLIIPNFEHFKDLRSIKIIIDADILGPISGFLVSDILKRETPSNVMRHRSCDFIRIQSPSGWYDPQPIGALNRINLNSTMEELGKQLPELKRFMIRRLIPKARGMQVCSSRTMNVTFKRNDGDVKVEVVESNGMESSPLSGKVFPNGRGSLAR